MKTNVTKILLTSVILASCGKADMKATNNSKEPAKENINLEKNIGENTAQQTYDAKPILVDDSIQNQQSPQQNANQNQNHVEAIEQLHSQLPLQIQSILRNLKFDGLNWDLIKNIQLYNFLLKNLPTTSILNSSSDLHSHIMQLVLKIAFGGQEAINEIFDPTQIKISSLTNQGSGCPTENSITYNISPDGQAITLVYGQFTVETAKSDVVQKNSKDCELNLKVDAPEGWAYSVISLQHQGFAVLEENSKGINHTEFRFSSLPNFIDLGQKVIDGVFDDNYQRIDNVTLPNIVWSSCNNIDNLILKTTLSVESQAGSKGIIGLDSFDSEIKSSFKLAWKKCN